jgi:hypothetical protein
MVSAVFQRRVHSRVRFASQGDVRSWLRLRCESEGEGDGDDCDKLYFGSNFQIVDGMQACMRRGGKMER